MTTTTSTFRRSSSNTPHVQLRWSTRVDGDFHRERVPFDELEQRRRHLVDLPWTQLDEHHGVGVVTVTLPGHADGSRGDVAITSAVDAVLGCWVGDCAPIVLVGAGTQLAVVHAGWRGLAAGIIDIAFAAFDEPVERALLGPVIGPCCYEFGSVDAAAVATGVHASIGELMSPTRWGTDGLDVTAAVRAGCSAHGVGVDLLADCTGCSFDGFSHRVRAEPERHVVAAWQVSTGVEVAT
ncbi:MAG TPA: laccase domain-containing protein [Ilumatobacter sp.]|nr:laccase domain-containing protein [Ilumatobacter sp.]